MTSLACLYWCLGGLWGVHVGTVTAGDAILTHPLDVQSASKFVP